MATKSEEIISFIEKKYPQSPEQLVIKNLPDKLLNFDFHLVNQYIIGVTRPDQFGNDIRHYTYQMKVQLENIAQNVECLPWPFSGDEKHEMRLALLDVSRRFGVEIDADKMIDQLKISVNDYGTFYIVITVVQYQIPFVNK